MLVASGLVSSDAEAKAVAQRHAVNNLSSVVLGERIEALRLCGWHHAGLLAFDADRLIQRSTFRSSLRCVVVGVRPRMRSHQHNVAGVVMCVYVAGVLSALESLKLLSSLQGTK